MKTPRHKENERLLIKTWAEEAIEEAKFEQFRKAVLLFAFGFMVVGLLVLFSTGARAENIPQDQAVKAIIGEAEGEGYMGMLAVACAIRNRGTLKGVYGLKAPRVVKKAYSLATLRKAQQAWQESKTKDLTNGANLWENVDAFGSPYWAKRCVKTIKIGNHQFYKGRL